VSHPLHDENVASASNRGVLFVSGGNRGAYGRACAEQGAVAEPARNHIAFFDGLRGIAVLLVVAYHLHERGLMPDPMPIAGSWAMLVPWPFLGGVLGVEIFFFLSGLVLFLPYARHLIEGRPRPAIGHFYLRRSLKIVPSYVVALLAIALTAPAEVPAGESLTQHVLLHLFFLHGFYPNAFASIIGPLWSLAVEVEFYVLFPLIVAIWLRNVWLGAVLMFAVSAIYRIHMEQTGLAGWFWNSYQLPGFLNLFAAGMLSAYLYTLARHRNWWFTTRPWISAGVAAVALVLFYALFRDLIQQPGGPGWWTWQNNHRDIVAGLLSVAAIFGPFGAEAATEVIANPVTQFLADISYNLYLWNKPLIIFFTATVAARGGWHAGSALGIVAVFGVCVAVAWFFTFFVERPFLERGWAVLPPIAALQRRIAARA
jgi:peptidoglycan/LPS O-acetylase OafA/YrhL